MGPRKIRKLGCTCPNCASGLNYRTKKKQHVCHYIGCGKVYGNTYHLHAHLRWHTGERPFLCLWPSCGRRFIRSDEMQRHHSVHMEKRFKCNECGKKFKRSDHLNQHINMHRKNHRVQVEVGVEVDIALTCREDDLGMSSPDSESSPIASVPTTAPAFIDTNAPSSSAAMQGVASSYGMGGEDLTSWEEDLGMSSPDSESSPIASVPTTAPAFIDTNAPSSSAAMQGVASSYGMGGEDLTSWEEDLGMSSPDSESSPIASVPTTAPAFIDTNAPSSSAAMQGVASSYGMGGEDLTSWEEDLGMSSSDSESSPIASVPTTAPAFIDTNAPSSSAAMQGVASSYGMGGEDLTSWEEDLGMSSSDSESSPIASVPTTAPAFMDTNTSSSSAAMQGVASSYPVSSGLHISELPRWLSHSLSIYHPALYADQISHSLT